MKLSCFIRGGELNLPPHSKEIIKTANDGSYVLDLKKEKSKATASMFSYLYGYCYSEILDATGDHKTKENIDRLDGVLKERYGPTTLVNTYQLRKHKIYTPESGTSWTEGKPFVKIVEKVEPKPKSKYTVEEMQTYWIALQQFAAEFFGLVLHDPDPDWKKHWKEADEHNNT